jgi:hypothetical protein
MGFTIEEKVFLLDCYCRNGVNRQSKKRPCIVSITLRMTKYEKRFNKTKEEVTLLIYFLFDHLYCERLFNCSVSVTSMEELCKLFAVLKSYST